jgi:hypothetical protein
MSDKKQQAAAAGCIDLDRQGITRIWIPPTGRPYWVRAGKDAGPDLTDDEIARYLDSPVIDKK